MRHQIIFNTQSCKMVLIAFIGLLLSTVCAGLQVNWQGPGGIVIKDVHYPEDHINNLRSEQSMTLFDITATETTTPYPVPPLAGFSPLIVITTSDEQGYGGDSGWEQTLESSFVGTALNPPADDNYIIGIYDSGADVDLFAGTSAEVLGLTGSNLTSNLFPIGGVGGTVNAVISQPVGIFAGGLSAIDPNDGTLSLSQLRGHSNVAALVTPPIICGNGESVSGVVGNPFIAFHTAVIRNDQNQKTILNGQKLSSPNVEIYESGTVQLPTYSRKIGLTFSGYATTANYFAFDAFSYVPEWPTMLTFYDGSLPLGGAFVATMYAVEGEPSVTNPLQEMTVLVDTGAQSSIISPGLVADLGLPIVPDFEVDVCGVGGLEEGVPGYYVDYIKINAQGGAMEFSNAPFVVLDLTLSDGTPIDGVLGMNFFWNRNIIFEPNPAGSGFLHVSDPVVYGNADFDFDGFVNLVDFAELAAAWMSQAPDIEYNPICDMYMDSRIDFKDLEAFIGRWLE